MLYVIVWMMERVFQIGVLIAPLYDSIFFLHLLAFFPIFRPFGTISLLSALMAEVVKDIMDNSTDEETWSWVARDILLDTWTTLLVVHPSSASFVLNIYIYMYMRTNSKCSEAIWEKG